VTFAQATRIAGTVLLTGAWSLTQLPGCAGDQCDPGWELKDHSCVPSAPADAGDGQADGATPTNQDTGTGIPEDPESDTDAAGDEAATGGDAAECASQLGATCTQTSECTCDTSFCASMPGSPGVCTRTGCLQDSSVCPSGWHCMDLSSYGAGLPSICAPD
jgi:hypothetical protein